MVDILQDWDLSERPYQIATVGAVAGVAIIAWNIRKGQGQSAPTTNTPRPQIDRDDWGSILTDTGPGKIGVVGQGEPGMSAYDEWRSIPENRNKSLTDYWNFLRGPEGPQGEPGAPGQDAPQPDPDPIDEPDEETPGWTPRYPGEINPEGKPYYCPSGSYMTTEKGSPSNHVCQVIGGTRQFQVSYSDPPRYRYPPVGGQNDVQEKSFSDDYFQNDFSGGPNPFGSIGGLSPEPAPIAAGGKTKIRAGENLKDVARRTYGTPQGWPLLVGKNRGLNRARTNRKIGV